MIPSDHFVRFYNEVFKAVQERSHDDLVAYWAELGRMQVTELGERFRKGGIKECNDYWQRIKKEENCGLTMTLTDDYLEMQMDKCPSLTKVLDNDAAPCDLYCDHCPGWVVPVMKYAGLYYIKDLGSRTEPSCWSRIYEDREKAEAFAKERGIELR